MFPTRRNLIKSLLLLGLVLALPVQAATAGPEAELAAVLAANKGKVVYLDFWASWCIPCRKSFPWLNALQKQYPDDLVVVGINVDATRADADRFLAKYPAGFPLVFDPAGAVAATWKLEGMPSSVLLGRDGREAHRHIGFRDDRIEDYEMVLKQLMKKHGE